MLRKQLDPGDLGDGLAGREAVGETGTHDAGKDGDGEALAKGKVALPGFRTVFAGYFVLLGIAGEAADDNRQHAHSDPGKDYQTGSLVQNGGHLAAEDRRHQGAEGGTKSERDRVSESDAKVTNRQAEGESANPPHYPPDTGIGDTGGRGFMKNGKEIRDQQQGQDRGRDDPGGNALNDPVNFPRPAPDSAKWNEIAGRS